MHNMSIENFLKNKGIVRNRKQANFVMLGIIIICIVIIFFVSRKSQYDNIDNQEALTPEEMKLMELQENIPQGDVNSNNNPV